MRHLALVLATIGCAMPADDELESASTTAASATYDSTWFRIKYWLAPPDQTPPPDCSPVIDIDGCYRSIAGASRPGVPDYVEDLGVFLDAARNLQQINYDLHTTGRMNVEVHSMINNGYVNDTGLIEIRNRVAFADPWTFATQLRDVAWHEVFHVAEHRAYDGPPPWTHWSMALRHRWLMESAAVEETLTANPVGGPIFYADPTLMLDFPLVIENGEIPDLRQYASFVFLRYLKARGIDFVRRAFGKPSPRFTLANAPPHVPIEEFFFGELRTLLPNVEARRDLFRDFALAYQLTRNNAVIPGVSELLDDTPRTYELTGFERKDPGPEDEPPRAIPNTVGDGKESTVVRAGTMATHAIGVANVLCSETGGSCNPDAIPVPEQAKLVIKIALRATSAGTDDAGAAGLPHYGAVWRLRGTAPPVRLDTFAGAEAERELVYSVADLRRRDRIVVTVVYDPEVAPTRTTGSLEVTAAFDNACRSKTVVVDHPDSQVGYYGGVGKLVETEKGCKKMLVKIWGGGGSLRHWVFGGNTHGDGGGGAFVGARVPVDPAGEPIRATVPFAGLTGTRTFPAFIYQPATPPAVPTVIAIAGSGGQAGVGVGTTILKPHAGAAHQNAPLALWTIGGNSIALSGGTAGTSQSGGIGGTNNTPYGDGRPFTTEMITGYTWAAGGEGNCESGAGGSGWFGGGGGGMHCPSHVGAGGGGGMSYVVPTRLGAPVASVLIGGDRRTPGRVDDPDRMTPVPPGTACQGGATADGDPGRGRDGAGPAWCDNPGRIVIKFGKAAARDTTVP